jgi:hypothetical protein
LLGLHPQQAMRAYEMRRLKPETGVAPLWLIDRPMVREPHR